MQTKHFKIGKDKAGRTRLWCLDKGVSPASVPLKQSDVNYLAKLNRKPNQFTGMSTFDCAAVMDFGCGVFQRNSR